MRGSGVLRVLSDYYFSDVIILCKACLCCRRSLARAVSGAHKLSLRATKKREIWYEKNVNIIAQVRLIAFVVNNRLIRAKHLVRVSKSKK